MTTYAPHTITLYHREGWSHGYTVDNSHSAVQDLVTLERLMGCPDQVFALSSGSAGTVDELVAMVDVVRVVCAPPVTATEWNAAYPHA